MRPRAAPPRPYEILCFGDSVTAGFYNGGAKYEPYGRTLVEALKRGGAVCEVATCGLCGLTSGQLVQSAEYGTVKDLAGRWGVGLAKILDSCREEAPKDLVVLMAGTNDSGLHLPPEEAARDVQSLHKICMDRGCPTVVISPPQVTSGAIRENRQRLHNLLEAWATKDTGVRMFLDIEVLCPRGHMPDFYEPEEFHLSPFGSIELGKSLAKHLLPLLSRLRPGPKEGAGSHRLVQPASTPADHVEAAGADVYTVGEPVQVWSNSEQAWCAGRVEAVEPGKEDPQVTVSLSLPSGARALKKLPSMNGNLRHVEAAPRDEGAAAYAPGVDVEVWSNTHKAWCRGSVEKVEDGFVAATFLMPNGDTGRKELPLGDRKVRLL